MLSDRPRRRPRRSRQRGRINGPAATGTGGDARVSAATAVSSSPIVAMARMVGVLSAIGSGGGSRYRSLLLHAAAFAPPASSSSNNNAACYLQHQPATFLLSKRRLGLGCSSYSSSSSFDGTSLAASRQSSADNNSNSMQIPNSNNNKNNNIRSIPFELDVEQTLAASGYKRPSVNWYPGHIAKAERQLSETLKSADVVVEVRDARAPQATAHPRVAEWAAGRPRVVVLTHVDSVPEASRVAWKKSYDLLGAGRWDGEVDGQVRNQAVQGMAERSKYSGGSSGSSSNNGGGGSGRQRMDNRSAVSRVEDVLFVDAKRGGGIHSINRAVLRAGSHVNERRARRGLSSRPLRVGIIGYPNVGKSALINKILGRKRAKTANTPGVTRTLQWIRVRTDDTKKNRGKEFELLDSPGIIPANMVDQSDALLLAACNSIGTAAYDNQAVAAYLMEWIKTLHLMGYGDDSSPKWREACLDRYGFDPLMKPDGGSSDRLLTGEDMLFRVADAKCRGLPEDASRMILQDFRAGRLGPVSLQLAPRSSDDKGQVRVDVMRGVASLGGVGEEMTMAAEDRERLKAEQRDERARIAVETAKERGVELPPMVERRVDGISTGSRAGDEADDDAEDMSTPPPKEDEIGKGLFDGW